MQKRISPLLSVMLIVSLALMASSVSPTPTRAQGSARVFDPNQAQRNTVQVIQVYSNPSGQTVMSCIGSGTLVSADGLILTNAHVVLPLAGCRADRIAIALTKTLGEAPVASYYADVVVYNLGWDLAVLRISQSIDGRPINREALALPFAELGNSDDVNLDATIQVVGYAAPERDEAANAVSTVIRATVSGFTSEARAGNRAWIKTRTALPGSMTGGGAYTTDGLLVGIPTVEPSSSGGPGSESPACRRIQDSNGDGRVDANDLCIPVSGLINAMRPARLARGLILAAKLGIAPETQPAVIPPPVTNGDAKFSRLFFSSGVDLAEMPTTIISRAPNGTKSLYLFFDYQNMRDGLIYELRVARNGIIDPTFSLAPATWSGGQRGMWYIGSTAQVWPDGDYEFSLFIEGTRSDSARITIGGQAQSGPEFSNILFGVLNPDNQLVSTGNILPVGNTLNAEFVYSNMTKGLKWRQVWYFNELRIAADERAWDGDTSGKQAANAAAQSGQSLQPGRYRLELYINDRLSTTSDFIMAGGQVALNTEIFKNLTFASELKENKLGGFIGATFPNTITDLYGVFDWRDMAPETPITWRWTVDDNLLFEVTQPWSNNPNGERAWLRLKSSNRITDGLYRLDLIIASVVKISATARVGLGQLPVSIFAVEQGVRLQGQVTDAETRRGLVGATVLILKSDFVVRDFTWRMTEVFDMVQTDAAGRFAASKLLPRDQRYSVMVLARSYLPATTDSLTLDATTRNPLEIKVELNKD